MNIRSVEAESSRIKLALSMRGGAAKCGAYLGMLRAFSENGIEFDIVGGSSGGALISAGYAVGLSVEEMAQIYDDLRVWKFFSIRDVRHLSFVSENNLKSFARRLVERVNTSRIEDSPRKLFIQVTNLRTKSSEFVTSGNIAEYLIASIAHPLFMKPVEVDGVHYIDGDITSGFEAKRLREWGADIVIGAGTGDGNAEVGRSMLARLLMPYTFASHLVQEYDLEKNPVDLLIDDLGNGFSRMDFRKIKAMTKVGYEQTLPFIPEVKKLIVQTEKTNLLKEKGGLENQNLLSELIAPV